MNFLLSFLEFHSCRFARGRKPGRMIPSNGSGQRQFDLPIKARQSNPGERTPIIGGLSQETFAGTILAASAGLRKRY